MNRTTSVREIKILQMVKVEQDCFGILIIWMEIEREREREIVLHYKTLY